MPSFPLKLIIKFFAIIFIMAGFLFYINEALAAISQQSVWTSQYASATYPAGAINSNYTITAGSHRLLVVAIASTRTTAGTQTISSVTYGGRALTLAAGDATSAATWNHSYLYYLNDAGIAAATGSNLNVTITGGTSYYSWVYASVYAGVDQTTPFTNAKNFNAGVTGTAVGPFNPTLTIGTNDQAIEIVNLARSTTGTAQRTVSTWATGWTTAGQAPASIVVNGPTATMYIRDRNILTAANDGSQHTASDKNTWKSMTAMSIKVAASASLSASPTACIILTGASSCTIPFTWSISNATTPNLYNATTATQYGTAVSGTGVLFAITNGSNTVQARDSTAVLASVSVTASCTAGTTWNGIICAVVPVTTIADGTAPTSLTVAPGSGVVDLDYFTLVTSTESDTMTAATVTLAPLGASDNIAQVDLTNSSNVAQCTAVTNPASNTVSFTGCSAGVTTGAATYKVRITPKLHLNMPAPSVGASYATTGTVTAFTSTNTHSGSDTSSATITVDNLSPANATSVSGNAGSAQVILNWISPTDLDYESMVVLRRIGSAVANVPAEGAIYTVANIIGTATVACVAVAPAITCNDSGLTNGTAYHYKIFSKDTNGNYSTGTIPTGSPFTPSVNTFTVTSTAGANGTITPLGATNVAQGSSQTFNITPSLGYDVATLTVDSVLIATSTSHTFTNVQATHTIDVTFSLLPVIHTITSSAGTGGTITPLGAVSVADNGTGSFTIAPANGYNIETLTIDGGPIATSTTYTFTNVITNHTISTTFSPIPPPLGSFTIIATAGANGNITPSGSTVVTQGSSQAYAITPNSGYNIESLTIDISPIATSTTHSFINVQTNHTIEATFVAIEGPGVTPSITIVPAPGATRPTTVTFSGKAFPGGKVSVINKELREEKIAEQAVTTEQDGTFSISFVGVLQALQSFGLVIRDKEGRLSQTKFFRVDTREQELTTKDIIIPPTIDILNGQVTRGKNVTIIGSATPNYTVSLELDGILIKDTLAGKDGSYKFEISTGSFDFGRHTIHTKQTGVSENKSSDFSTSRTFIVSNLAVVQTDLNGDGKVDVRDWSIFLARFTSRNPEMRKSIDLTGDGKVDISDFSVFIKTIRKK